MAQETLDLLLRSRKTGTGVADASKELEGLQKRTDGVAASFKSLAVGLGLAKVGAEILKFGKASIEAASNVEEMASKFAVVFGSSAPAAEAALAAFGNEVNRSKFELMGMAASVQDTFVPLGFARNEASKLSVELTKLATDVASFNNAADADVMRDFQSAIVGNHETVRKYGIVITEATLGQELLAMGIEGGIKAATEQEKVQARLNMIMKGTSDAHGDAARTADSYANTTRGLDAAIEELSVTIGNRLLPAASDAANALTKLINGTTNTLVATDLLRRSYDNGLITLDVYKDYIVALRTGEADAAEMVIYLTEAQNNYTSAIEDGAKRQTEYYGVTWGATEATKAQASAVYDATAAMEAAKGPAQNYDRDLEEVAASANAAAAGVGSLLDQTNRNIGSAIESTIKDLQWLQAGGADIEAAAGAIKEAILNGTITPAEGEAYLKELYLEATNLQLELDQINADTAGENLARTLGIPLEQANSMVDRLLEFNGRTIDLKVMIAYVTSGIGPGVPRPGSPGYTGGSGRAYDNNAAGASFTVPPGYNEAAGMAYWVPAQSGEHVTIEPNGAIRGGGGGSGGTVVFSPTLVVNPSAGMDEPLLAAEVMRLMNERYAESLAAGIGFTGAR